MKSLHEKSKLTTYDITLMGLMVAMIEACKMALSGLPNVELTSFWIIMFTIFFGRKILFVIPAFILVEGCIYGFGLWWIMYLYAWPLLALIAWCIREKDSVWLYSIVSALFGLFFGMLCSIPYFFIGCADGGVVAGLSTAFAWWIAGIPWDLVHCAGNFVIMLVLYKPVRTVMKKIVVKNM